MLGSGLAKIFLDAPVELFTESIDDAFRNVFGGLDEIAYGALLLLTTPITYLARIPSRLLVTMVAAGFNAIRAPGASSSRLSGNSEEEYKPTKTFESSPEHGLSKPASPSSNPMVQLKVKVPIQTLNQNFNLLKFS